MTFKAKAICPQRLQRKTPPSAAYPRLAVRLGVRVDTAEVREAGLFQGQLRGQQPAETQSRPLWSQQPPPKTGFLHPKANTSEEGMQATCPEFPVGTAPSSPSHGGLNGPLEGKLFSISYGSSNYT